MKTITFFTVCLSILAIFLPSAPSEILDGPYDVEIKGHKNGQGNNGRGELFYCAAFYYASDSILEINTYNIGAATVSLFDCNNDIVANDSVYGTGQEHLILHVPARAGNYKVVVSSSEYYGEGYFVNY